MKTQRDQIASALQALESIANMRITESTDKSEVLALCMSIARIEVEKKGHREAAEAGAETLREVITHLEALLEDRERTLVKAQEQASWWEREYRHLADHLESRGFVVSELTAD